MPKPFALLHLLLYSLVICLTFSIFLLFRPFSYVDNDTSQIVCSKTGGSFNIGPNYIYTLADTLDAFNDAKARKLCEYGIIRDYGNTYQTPAVANYEFRPVSAKASSWGDALLMAVALFFLGTVLIEGIKKTTYSLAKQKEHPHQLTFWYFLASLIMGVLLFLLVAKKPTVHFFCTRQIAHKVVNFRNSAFKYGVIKSPEEDEHINKTIPAIYQKCLENEGY